MGFFPWAFDTPHFNFTTHHPSLFSDSRPGCAEDVILAIVTSPGRLKAQLRSHGKRRRVTEMVANHKNAKRQGVKACLRPVWNITALRQTWKSKLHGTVWQYLPTHCNVWSAGIVQDQGATKASKVVTKSHFSPGANFRIAPKSFRLTLVEFLQTCQALETTWNH